MTHSHRQFERVEGGVRGSTALKFAACCFEFLVTVAVHIYSLFKRRGFREVPIHMCDVTHAIHMCDVTHAIHMCDMTRDVTHPVHMCDMTHSFVACCLKFPVTAAVLIYSLFKRRGFG